MKCAVLGGGGFIGSHLCEALRARGDEVLAFDRPDARFLAEVKQAGTEIVTGDFLTPETYRAAISGCDVVYHLVSTTVPQNSNEDPVCDVESNVLGALRFFQAAGQAGVKRIVFSSSGGTVYGIPQEIPIKESHPTEPICSYGITKLTVEKYLHLFSLMHGFSYGILRPANAYGPRQPTTGTQGVIGVFIDRVLHDSEITVWGDGSVVRDYLHVKDLVAAFLKAGEYEGEHRIFNIGGGKGYSLNDVIQIMEQVAQKPLKTEYLSGRTFDIPVNVLDISRAAAHLMWRPAVGIVEGMSTTYQWMRHKE